MLDHLFKIINKFTPDKYRWVLSHEGFRRYFANTGWMFFGQMFALVLSFIIGAWLARYLGPAAYGKLNYALAFAGLFGFIASLGVDSILVRELVKFPEKKEELLGTSFILKLIGGTAAFLLTVIATRLLVEDLLSQVLIIVFAASFIIQSLNVISFFFQARVEARNNVRAQIIASLITAVLKITFILSEVSLFWLMTIFVLDGLWQVIIYTRIYQREGNKLSQWRFNRPLAKKVWHDSWLLMLSSAAAFIMLKIDQVMVGQMMGEKEVGIYAAAVKFVEIWYFLPGIICASLFPAIINAKAIGLEIYHHRLRSLYKLMIVLAVGIAIPTSLLAFWAVKLLFGMEYLLAVPILQIYVWSGVGLFWGWAINQYLMAENKTRAIFALNLVAMLVNILLNLILIPLVGLIGAALATLISYFILPLFSPLFWFKKK